MSYAFPKHVGRVAIDSRVIRLDSFITLTSIASRTSSKHQTPHPAEEGMTTNLNLSMRKDWPIYVYGTGDMSILNSTSPEAAILSVLRYAHFSHFPPSGYMSRAY